MMKMAGSFENGRKHCRKGRNCSSGLRVKQSEKELVRLTPSMDTILQRLSKLSNCLCLTHSLVHHFETVLNSKKQQTTTEVWL